MTQLEDLKEQFAENGRITIEDTSANGGRIPMLVVTAAEGYTDMPYTLMLALQTEYDRVHLYQAGATDDARPVLIFSESTKEAR